MCLQTLTNSHYPQPNYTQEFSPKILTLSFSKLSTDVIYFVLLLLFCVVITMVCKQAIYRGAKSLPHLLPITYYQLFTNNCTMQQVPNNVHQQLPCFSNMYCCQMPKTFGHLTFGVFYSFFYSHMQWWVPPFANTNN